MPITPSEKMKNRRTRARKEHVCEHCFREKAQYDKILKRYKTICKGCSKEITENVIRRRMLKVA